MQMRNIRYTFLSLTIDHVTDYQPQGENPCYATVVLAGARISIYWSTSVNRLHHAEDHTRWPVEPVPNPAAAPATEMLPQATKWAPGHPY